MGLGKKEKWPNGGSSQSQSAGWMRPHATTMKPTGTGGWTDGQDHVLGQADALTKDKEIRYEPF